MTVLLLGFVFCICGLAGLGNAHGGVNSYAVGDKWYKGYDPDVPFEDQDGQPWLVSRPWLSINPIFEADNASLACNVPGSPAPSSIPIIAGESITALYYYWVHTIGPMVLWMADCGGGCEDFDSSEGRWFKIAERGLLSGRLDSGWWFQRDFSQHWDGVSSNWTETIPKTLKSGNYLIRHEIIALHSANKPQFYPECAQLKVTGDGNEIPEEEYYGRFPGVWSMNQPEINIDVYAESEKGVDTYKIPGPPVWRGSAPVLEHHDPTRST